MKFNREWCMPNSNTLLMKPAKDFVMESINQDSIVIDPFARDCEIGTITNDLNEDTKAEYHLKAEVFCQILIDNGTEADVIIFDPPYSTRQIKECYDEIGIGVSFSESKTGQYYMRIKDLLTRILKPSGIVFSFGWNSSGFGLKNGFELEEVLILCHGGMHNDTIITKERLIAKQEKMFV